MKHQLRVHDLKDVDISKIRKILIKMLSNKLGLSEYEVLNSTFYDMGTDSLDAIEIAMDIEKEFNIEIPDEREEENY